MPEVRKLKNYMTVQELARKHGVSRQYIHKRIQSLPYCEGIDFGRKSIILVPRKFWRHFHDRTVVR